MAENTQLYEYRNIGDEIIVQSTVDEFVTKLEADEIKESDGSIDEHGVSKELVYDSEYLKTLIKVRHSNYIEDRGI